MDRTKTDTRIDQADEQARETMELFNDKIDDATRCTEAETDRIGDSEAEK